jgi:hypothetical protein
MLRTFLLRASLACMAIALGTVALPARASFGDCNDPAYLARFDARLATDTDYLCVASEPVPVRSDAGTTHIRIIQHLVADWATAPGAMRAIEEGVLNSALAMSRLGSFEMSDATILLVDDFSPAGRSENFGDLAARTRHGPDECQITLWLLGPGATADHGAAVVAHELFHCVQDASLSQAQMRTVEGSSSGRWWIEGSASWFMTLAVPAPAYMRTRVAVFDRDSPRVALNQMSYDAYVFFAWLAGAHGMEAVMPFLHAMAPSADEAAQRAAMTRALSAEEWLHFAEDYLDQRIRDGHGVDIGSTPLQGATYTWDATRTQRVALQPFVLMRADLTVRCGRWRFEPAPARFHAASPGTSEAWAPVPASLDAMDGEREFRFAGMAAGSDGVALRIAGTREASCSECAGTHEVDQCLVGTWELTTHGAEQWMREHGQTLQLTSVARANNTMTLLEDGTFATGAARVDATVRSDDMRGAGGMVGQSSGRWSAAGGRFNVCPDATALTGTVTVIVHGRSVTVPTPSGPALDSSQPYTCNGTSLQVTMSMGSAGTVQSVYTKVSGPLP